MSFVVGALVAVTVGGVVYLARRSESQSVAPSNRASVLVARAANPTAPKVAVAPDDAPAAGVLPPNDRPAARPPDTVTAAVPVVERPEIVAPTAEAPGSVSTATELRDESHSAATAAVEVAGAWELTNTIVETRDPALRGSRAGYQVVLERHGDRLSGRGEKSLRDNRTLPPHWRTPVRVTGGVEEGQVVLHIVENSRRRTTTGTYRLQASPDGSQLLGSFDSDVADTRGTTIGRRVSSARDTKPTPPRRQRTSRARR
jgi:hypothetical protein